MKIISDNEVIRYILQQQNRYVCYLGAGASAEAEVKTAQQICDDIRQQLLRNELPVNSTQKQIGQWENSRLDWDDPSRRYSTSIHAYGNPAMRVKFFRDLLKGKSPAFCHHALALLMARRHLKNVCLTTNFDKLLESAFMRQAGEECQPIRTEEELKYWETDQERCYAVKLHGDYDTNNIMNTDAEVVLINDKMKEKVKGLLKSAGMLVLGTAGYEKSVYTLFDFLTSENAENEEVLSFGLFWGVYMGKQKPKNLTAKQLEKKVEERVREGVIGPDIAEMMERASQRNERFCFFPIWGTGAFMFDLIRATENKLLIGTAELYLDHVMRLRTVFTRAGLSDAAVDKHIASLREQQQKISPKTSARAPAPELVFKAHSKDKKRAVELSVIYGDITSRSQMSAPELQHLRRAVISPEDTCISAGGGVAYLLLEKAGPYTILNELAKFSPIEHDTVSVTSGGNLPVHYIFHAAAIEIDMDANYAVSKEDVARTMTAALEKAKALDVGVLWVPLMGAGVGSLGSKKSFEGIIESIVASMSKAHKMKIMIVIYRERELPRNEISRILQKKLSKLFSIQAV